MRTVETGLPGVLVIEPAVHRDVRGFFVETYHAEKLAALGIEMPFVQSNHSRSVRNTLRGLHWQWRRPQAKLVRVVRGEVFQVVVDVRRASPTLGQWIGITLNDDNLRQTFVPAGFAHGFCVLSDLADLEYFCTAPYDPSHEAGLPWNDPGVAIRWPVDRPILSHRDCSHPPLHPERTDLVT